MKSFVFIFVWQVVVGCLHAQGDASPFEGLEGAVGAVQEESVSSAEDISFENLERLHVALAANRGNIWQMPVPILDQLRSEVEPIRGVVFELAASGEKNRRFYASVFASYLEPTNATKELLEKLAHDEHAPASGTAMDTLFGMGWESERLRGDVVSSLERQLEGESSTMASLARNNVGEWGVSEAAPILMELLEKEYAENGKITSVATQIKLLGDGAKNELPKLRELLLRVEADPNSHPREVEALGFAIGVISGEFDNDSSGKVVRRGPDQESRLISPEEASSPGLKPKKSATGNDDLIQEANDSGIQLWPPILGVIAVLCVAVILVRAFMRRSAS